MPTSPTPSFVNFDLQIKKLGKKYQALVLEAPAGQASSEFSLRFSPLELENFYLRVSRPRQGVRRIDSPEMDIIKKMGGRLFEAVFSDELLALLSSSQVIAQSQGKRLRIRLRLDSPEAGDLPWEYLYDANQNRFLALALQTPVVRYLEVAAPTQPLVVDLPLKVLVMVSSPRDYPPLDVETEYGRLRGALQPLIEKGLVSVERLGQASLDELQRHLRSHPQHIFHFIGHGGFDPTSQEGIVVFEDKNNLGKHVSGQELGWLLHNYPSLRLAVLNACEGARSGTQDPFAGVAQNLVQQGLPAVIAMQFEITDQAALSFTQNFYTSLADGSPVDAALSEARISIFTSGNDIEWGTPVLFTRSSDGRLFDIPSASPLSKPPESPLTSATPGQDPTALSPTIQMAEASLASKSALKRFPLWGWILVTLFLIGAIAGGSYLLNIFTQTPPTETRVAMLSTATEFMSIPVAVETPSLEVIAPTTSPQAAVILTDSPGQSVQPTNIRIAPPEDGLQAQITDEQGVPMVLIPEGAFQFGNEMGEPDEKPSQTIFLDAFYIDQFEVTNARYKKCVEAGACEPPEDRSSYTQADYYDSPIYAEYPVLYINWQSAQTYCEWRGGRLPTEAEWEKAGRGIDGRTYPWGEGASCSLANMITCEGDVTQVGSYPGSASPYNVMDMSGNVWEWTADWYAADYYATLAPETRNPTGPGSGTARVIRGGSWADDRYQLRITERFSFNPQGTDNALGFRCTRTP